ncbi:MAG: hypothetical protein K2X93_09445 [Candidatus Obscuribacterales bacterium]|nr:hypothetical protein [Candidatus Obscuribacterales bacterium]
MNIQLFAPSRRVQTPVSLLLLAFCLTNSQAAFADDRAAVPKPFDGRKTDIEAPLKMLIKSGSSGAPSGSYARRDDVSRRPAIPVDRFRDMRKTITEQDMKIILRSDSSGSLAVPVPTPVSMKSSSAPRSTTLSAVPTIENRNMSLTGLVSWCRDRKEAQSRSSKSGKPVFLFHMMGRLDDRFC